MIVESIYKDSMLALKEGRKEDREVLSTLSSLLKNRMIEIKSQSLPDNECVKIIQKFIKTLDDEILMFKNANRESKVLSLTNQKNLILKYLPKMLSKDEIEKEILNLDDKSIPSVMKYFKNNFSGKVDMKLVNLILKERFN